MNNFYCGLTKKRRDHYIDQFESTPPQNAFTQGSSFLTNFFLKYLKNKMTTHFLKEGVASRF